MDQIETQPQHDGPGVHVYRWAVLGGLAILGALSMRVLVQIDKTADRWSYFNSKSPT